MKRRSLVGLLPALVKSPDHVLYVLADLLDALLELFRVFLVHRHEDVLVESGDSVEKALSELRKPRHLFFKKSSTSLDRTPLIWRGLPFARVADPDLTDESAIEAEEKRTELGGAGRLTCGVSPGERAKREETSIEFRVVALADEARAAYVVELLVQPVIVEFHSTGIVSRLRSRFKGRC